MKNALNVDLLISGLTAGSGENAPALARLLRFARPVARLPEDDTAWLCRFFGVARQRDWPMAPYSALGDGLDPAGDYWFCLAPLHLQLQRDSFAALHHPGPRAPAHAADLLRALNAHFAEDGMRFHVSISGRWYLSLPQPVDMQTTPLHQVLGRDIAQCMPVGREALPWHRWMNEVQMLLHDHPVNQALEASGNLPVNSLWLWGGGMMSAPAADSAAFHVISDEPLARGLAQAGGGVAMPATGFANAWFDDADVDRMYLVLLDMAHLSTSPDSAKTLDHAWLAPLLQALRERRVYRLGLHLATGRAVNSYELRPADFWRFWRRIRSMEAYLG